MFQILSLDGARATEQLFSTAEAANSAAEEFRKAGSKVRISVVVTDEWRHREYLRLVDGIYQPLPREWTTAAWWVGSAPAIDHFAHRSDDGARVAFTESPEKGMLDRQLVLDPGKYLARYFGKVLDQAEIKRLALIFNAPPVALQFAETPDDIERVYADHNVSAGGSSGRSCMSYDAEHFDSSCHPARVYGAGDLAVAYTMVGESVAARVLCWPERQLYTRLYGRDDRDIETLRGLLQREGYRYADALTGARLLRIEQDWGGFVVPYLDGGCQSLRDTGRYLVISNSGHISADSTNGLSEPMMRCARCDSGMSDDDSYTVGDESWCEHCYCNHTYRCDRCEDIFADSETSHRVGDEEWCPDCARYHATECEHCGEYVSSEDGTVDVAGDCWCDACVSRDAVRCDRCDEYHPVGSLALVVSDDRGHTEEWCSDCTETDTNKCACCGALISEDVECSECLIGTVCAKCFNSDRIGRMDISDAAEMQACANDPRQLSFGGI